SRGWGGARAVANRNRARGRRRWREHGTFPILLDMSHLRALRIELGQTQDTMTERALATGRVRATFNRTLIARAEAPKPAGLRSHEIRLALAAGLGLSIDDLDGYLEGTLTLREAVAKSSIRPDEQTVARLKAAEAKRSEKTARGVGNGEKAEKMPNLRAVIDFTRRVRLPEAFLRTYERSARKLGEDR